MITVSVGALLAKTVTDSLGHLIYVVRAGDLIFYVGQSRRDVLTRFAEHVQKPSRLGQLIRLNAPASHDWLVDFYALADCTAFVRQKSLFALQAWQHFDMDMAEQAMIAAMRPVLNLDFNEKPTPLPARYRGHAALQLPKPVSNVSPTTSPQDRIWLNRMSLQGWVYEKTGTRTIWRHRSGKTLTEAEMAPYRYAGRVPRA
ncbi:MAG: hypothetical protein KC445_14735 [Anaerolineales bacterium]|nr:hypothetical protein [Anaerolineales bacterium]